MNLKYPFYKYVAFRCDLDPADMEKKKKKIPTGKKSKPAGYFASKNNFFKICYKKKGFFFTSS